MSPAAHGGIGAYQRFLAQTMAKRFAVKTIARTVDVPARIQDYVVSDGPRKIDDDGFVTELIAPRPLAKPLLRKLPTFIARRPLWPIARKIFDAAYGSAVASALSPETNIIHYVGTGWETLGFTAQRLAKRRNAVFAVTPFVHPGAWGDDLVDIDLYRMADVVFVESQFETNYLIERGVPPHLLTQVGLAPASNQLGDGERFRREHQLGDRPVVLFIARRQKYKGYHVLREAMADVLKQVPDAALVVIGPDMERPYPELPERAVVDLGTLGWSDEAQQKKADALAACNVYAMPSNFEAFGIVYVEAWSHGKAVIGGPAPAVLELIDDGVNGLHVTQDKASVTSALLRLLTNPALARRMGEAGKALQLARYTWEYVAAQHVNVYDRCRQPRMA